MPDICVGEYLRRCLYIGLYTPFIDLSRLIG